MDLVNALQMTPLLIFIVFVIVMVLKIRKCRDEFYVRSLDIDVVSLSVPLQFAGSLLSSTLQENASFNSLCSSCRFSSMVSSHHLLQ